MSARMEMIGKVGEFIGRYYSEKWVRRNILRQSDDEIESMDIEIAQEKAKGDISVTAGENVAQGGGQDMAAMGGAPDMSGGMPPPELGGEAPPELAGAPEAEASPELAGAPEAPPAALPGAPAV